MAPMKASFVPIACLLFTGFVSAADNAPGETAQVMARTIIVAVKAALTTVDPQKVETPSGKVVRECIQAVEPSQIEDVMHDALVRIFGEDDLKVSDRFFAGQAGKDFMLNAEAAAYQKLGVQAPQPPPKFTPAAEQEITEFFSTPAGRKFYASMSSMDELKGPLTNRILDLAKACLADYKARAQ
jgi:hypothetical protein